MSSSAIAQQGQTTNSTFVNSIYTSRKIILEIMETLGYQVKDHSHFTFNEISSMYMNKQLDLLLEKEEEHPATGKKQKIFISYYLNKVIRDTNIHEMIEDLFHVEEVLTKNDTLMIIVKDDMNETLMNELIHIWEKDGIFVVVQSLKRLQFNILKHSFVPEHKVLSSLELEEMMKKYNVQSIEQMPEISRFDPVAQTICLRPGEVCKIMRPSKTAIKSPYYRACVNISIF